MRVALIDEHPDVGEFLREQGKDAFTTVVSRGFIEGRSAIVLVGFGDEEVEFVGHLERTRPAATFKDGVRCSELAEIDPPILLENLRSEVAPAFRRHISYRTLPPATGEEVLDALVRLRPGLADVVRGLRREPTPSEQESSEYQTVAMERDAIGLAVDIFGGDRADLAQWTPGDTARPFLVGLENATLREDQIIIHDAGVFGDWQVVQQSAVGAVEFVRGGRRLTVINVNRHAIEATLGVDLVYYNEFYDAFVLVQYKRMSKESGGNWLYRPDGNHDSEVARMEAIPHAAAEPLSATNYRLNFGACFVKLCETTVFDPRSTDLLRGMYLPIEYLAATTESARGSRGGIAYGYSTVPRHLNNTQFVNLVQDAWIGSSGLTSATLRTFVEARIQDGRSMVLASASSPAPRAARR
ncbi:hypothetical protein OJ998_00425 [Solirubrobacter taibaiensis]|nr:hypothetical protein [Solirubrobacter taibaiensis]